MKLKISNEKYQSFCEEQKEALREFFSYNGKERAWYSKLGLMESGTESESMRIANALGVYPTVFYLPTREEYASLTLEEKETVRKYFEWNNKIIGWESRADRGEEAYAAIQEKGLPGACSHSLEESMQDQIAHGVEAIKTSKQFTDYLDAMSKFTHYSVANMILIAAQNPDATLVGGKGTWHKQGRYINDDAEGILIRAPQIKKVEVPDPTPDDPDHVKLQTQVAGFFPVKVFDITETHGKPLPVPPMPQQLTENVDHFDALMESIKAAAAPYTFTFQPTGTANGWCNFTTKEIAISDTLSPAQTIKTSFHETAHSKLHDPNNQSAADNPKVRNLREVQAESVAYICCKHYGIDSSDYSFGYIAGWSPENVEETMNILETAALHAHEICSVVDQELTQRLDLSQQVAHEDLQLQDGEEFTMSFNG